MANCGNMYAKISNLYGEDRLKDTRTFENLYVKIQKIVDDLTFFTSISHSFYLTSYFC